MNKTTTPDSHVIPKPREESGAATGVLRFPLPCRGDRLVALPGVGPLTLSSVEGSSGRWPTLDNPSCLTNQPTPDSHVIPMPREESGAVRGGLRSPIPCRGDRLVALPGVGPLTLSSVEGSSGGWPTPDNPSRMTNHPTPDSHVIPMPREESQASARPSAPALVSLIIHQGVERSAPSPSTKLETHTCAKAQVCVSVYFSPSPLKALSLSRTPIREERGSKGVRVPFPLPVPLGKDISKMQCIFDMSIKQGGRVGLHLIPGRSRVWRPIPSPLPGTELGTSACAEAHALVPNLLSPSPLMGKGWGEGETIIKRPQLLTKTQKERKA